MAYKDGYCPQCDEQIKVTDVKGNWCAGKKNFRQAELYYSNGHKVRTIICDKCLASPDFKVLHESITGPGSKASGPSTLEMIKSLGEPIMIKEV